MTKKATKYKEVSPDAFIGKEGAGAPFSFPMDTLERASSALSYAHYAPNPESIKSAVYKKYPQLKSGKSAKE